MVLSLAAVWPSRGVPSGSRNAGRSAPRQTPVGACRGRSRRVPLPLRRDRRRRHLRAVGPAVWRAPGSSLGYSGHFGRLRPSVVL